MASILHRLRHRSLFPALLAALALFAAPAAAHAASDQAVAYQLDPAHDGDQTADPIVAPLGQVWSDSFPGAVSYPLIVNGVVYVTARPASGYGTTLYAVEQATGAVLWSHALGGGYNFSGIAYDAGRIFAVDYEGQLTAFDATSGATDWTVSLPGQWAFTSPPTAADGYVYLGGAGSGGTLYAVSEETGAVAWTAEVENGDASSPAVSSTGVYVGYACNQDYDFDPFTGSEIWRDSGNCEGGGGATPVLAGDDVLERDGDLVLNAASGSEVAPFSATYAPAAAGDELFAASPGTISASNDLGAGTIDWTFSGDAGIDTAPIVDGSLVFEGSSTGDVYALDAANGQVVWSTDTGTAISASIEGNAVPLTGLGVGENTLVVPAGSTLLAYDGANVGTGTPVDDVAPSVSGAPVATEAIGADVGVWTALPTGYAYQWSLCDPTGQSCSAISADGTGESYTPPSSDVGDTLEVTVTATNGSGTSTSVTSAASSPIEDPGPVDDTAPSISGAAQVGEVLTASAGTWSDSAATHTYQWLRCTLTCTPIAGATSDTYLVSGADATDTIAVEVSATDVAGTNTATSPRTAAVSAMPTTVTLRSSAVISTGGASVTLTASVSPDVDGGSVSFTADGAAIPGCSSIAAAGGATAACAATLQPGAVTVAASYSGDTDFAASSASITQTVTSPPSPTPLPPASALPAAVPSPQPAPASTSSAPPLRVTIDAVPPAKDAHPTIDYTSSGAVTATTCTIDRRATPCSSTRATLRKLARGRHIFEVTVHSGETGATAAISWTVTARPAGHAAADAATRHRRTKAKTRTKKRSAAGRR